MSEDTNRSKMFQSMCRPPALKWAQQPRLEGSESQLVKSILAVVALRYKGRLILTRNNVGCLKDATGRPVRYGLGVGSADLVGCLRGGRYVALECKTSIGRVSLEQRQWLAQMTELGAVAVVVRSVEEACEAIDGALAAAEQVAIDRAMSAGMADVLIAREHCSEAETIRTIDAARGAVHTALKGVK